MIQAIIHSSMTLILLAKIIPQVCLRTLTMLHVSSLTVLAHWRCHKASLVDCSLDSLSLCITLSVDTAHFSRITTDSAGHWQIWHRCSSVWAAPVLGTVHKLAENLHDFLYWILLLCFPGMASPARHHTQRSLLGAMFEWSSVTFLKYNTPLI